MRTNRRFNSKGFTLVEVMLVLVIVAMAMYGAIRLVTQRAEQARIDRSSLQMQQILNAGLAYYLQNGYWPDSVSCLQGGSSCTVTYLPSSFNSPWSANPYSAGPCTSTNFPNGPNNPAMFCVSVDTVGAINGQATANILAGTLPLATVTGLNVTAYVNIPGQNLNNARAVNFAGLYHHGGCVPVPSCPVDPQTGITMIPQIMVVPVQVSGLNDPITGPNPNVYPISSFTAYATGNANPPTSTSPPLCTGQTALSMACTPEANVSAYWRVCMQIVTEKGDVATTNPGMDYWGHYVTMLAITRCAVNNEPAGSTFSVYGN